MHEIFRIYIPEKGWNEWSSFVMLNKIYPSCVCFNLKWTCAEIVKEEKRDSKRIRKKSCFLFQSAVIFLKGSENLYFWEWFREALSLWNKMLGDVLRSLNLFCILVKHWLRKFSWKGNERRGKMENRRKKEKGERKEKEKNIHRCSYKSHNFSPLH